ncbi:MAG: OmpH family outer membrane protein [Bacteroidales bacterium]|nr:OmpH family outer membrane protein [Bacteroidales bacterium]
MKNINYIINGILAAAVIVLFVLQFSGKSTGETSKTGKSSVTSAEQPENAIPAGEVAIAYFEIDSVLANWEHYFAVQEKLAAKQRQLETDFDNKSKSFMKRVEDAQYKIQRQLVTRAEAEQLQQQLATEEQNLMGLQNNYTTELQEEGMVRNRQMIDNIERYVEEYNKDKGYSFIFSYSFGGNLMYGDEAYNITEEIIEGINEAYPVEVQK